MVTHNHMCSNNVEVVYTDHMFHNDIDQIFKYKNLIVVLIYNADTPNIFKKAHMI